MIKSKKILGIDLGTTNSCISIKNPDGSRMLNNILDGLTTPSAVSFELDHTIYGTAALRKISVDTANTITVFKRLMGLSYREAKKLKLSYKITPEKDGDEDSTCTVLIGDKKYTPEHISGLFLRYLTEQCSKSLGEEIERVVITVPAHFNNKQRDATKDAGKIAGLKVERIINEPTAAAMAYGIDNKEEDSTILVYDFGGGTFDVTILEIANGVYSVISTGGDNMLGGEDLDIIITDYVLNRFKIESGLDFTKDKTIRKRTQMAAKLAKENLSSSDREDVIVNFVGPGPTHINVGITREWLESQIKPMIDKTIKITKEVIKDSEKKKEDISKIILAGGSTKTPLVSKMIEQEFNCKPQQDINPDHAVAIGAAVQGAIITGDSDIVLVDVTPLNLGIEAFGGEMAVIIPKNTPIPCKLSKMFTNSQARQTHAHVKVFQGNRYLTEHNSKVGEITVEISGGDSPHTAQIEVALNIDANGMLSVTAKDEKIKKPVNSTLHLNKSAQHIQDMQKDSEESSEADKLFQEIGEVRKKISDILFEVHLKVKKINDKDFVSKIDAESNIIRDSIASSKITKESIEQEKSKAEEILNKCIEKEKESGPSSDNNNNPEDNNTNNDDEKPSKGDDDNVATAKDE